MLQQKADQQGVSLKDISMKWSVRVFRALDSESRGHIFNYELLDHIKASGTYTNIQLRDLVAELEDLSPKEQIDVDFFEKLI